jgi:hypothetical protein
VAVVPDVEVVPDEDVEPYEDHVPDEEGAALAGAAMVRAVPPRAASPNVKMAAELAMRVSIMRVPFLEAWLAGREKNRARPSMKRQCPPLSVAPKLMPKLRAGRSKSVACGSAPTGGLGRCRRATTQDAIRADAPAGPVTPTKRDRSVDFY